MKSNKSYWKIGAGVGLVLASINILYPKILFPASKFFINFWCDNFIFPFQLGDNKTCDIIAPLVILTIVLIVVGGLAGYILGKIRSKAIS